MTSAVSTAPGAQLGRFTVTGELGTGAMGVVLAAYDPTLARAVALKLLHAGAAGPRDEAAQALLQREAQAMARLSHPNVVQVFEVGRVGDQLFVAMELVRGQTLTAWLAARPRPWRERVALFISVGRGLEAVHAAGLVHRDFKPDNVLVGDDGRPRVGDFGLVDLRATRPREGDAATVAATQSQAGATAYLAPEQARGEPGDARADQFSFCVALYHALYGERPFAAAAPPEERHAPARPPRARVPARLFAVLARGLAAEPAQRWPDMGALLAALAHDRAALHLRRVAVAALLLLAATAVTLGLRARAVACRGGAARLAGIWDDSARATLQRAFAGSGLAYADDTFARVRARLDEHTRAWIDAQESTCRDGRDGRAGRDVRIDLRFTCLERQRATLAALIDLWRQGVDARALANAIAAVAALPSPSECADARALTAGPPRDQAAAIAATRARLDHALALFDTGRIAESRDEAEAARLAADRIGWPELQAEALYQLGWSQRDLVDARSEVTLGDAAALAGRAHDDRLAARALVQLGECLVGIVRDGARALLVVRLAEGALQRAGDDHAIHAQLESVNSSALALQSRYAEAKEAIARARRHVLAAKGPDSPDLLTLLDDEAHLAMLQGDPLAARRLYEEEARRGAVIFGPDHPEVAITLGNVGTALDDAGDFAAAIDMFRRALAIEERAFGRDSGRVAVTLGNLANPEGQLGRLDDAAAHYERAIAIGQRTLGADNADVAAMMTNLSGLRVQQGRADDALALARRSLAIADKTYGVDGGPTTFGHGAVADALFAQGDFAGAFAEYEHARVIAVAKLGARHPQVQSLVEAEGNTRCRQHRFVEGAAQLRAAIAGFIEVLGSPDKGYIGRVTGELGRCLVDGGQPRDALPLLERARVISEKGGEPAGALAAIRFTRARALFALGEHARALSEAREAERTLSGSALSRVDLLEARRWLALHQ